MNSISIYLSKKIKTNKHKSYTSKKTHTNWEHSVCQSLTELLPSPLLPNDVQELVNQGLAKFFYKGSTARYILSSFGSTSGLRQTTKLHLCSIKAAIDYV